MTCTICNAPGTDGHNHTDQVLCNAHASQWYAGVATASVDAWRTAGETGPDLRQWAHDKIIAAMRADFRAVAA